MGATPQLGFVYPDPGAAPDGPYAMQQLAESVESWGVDLPANSEAGQVAIGAILTNAFQTYAVTFTAGRFATAPKVFVCASTGRLNAAARDVTTGGCTVELYNCSGANSSTTGEFFQWLAVED